jgi:hypothetical protein
LFKWESLHDEKMDRSENEHENVWIAADPVPDTTPESCRPEFFGRECNNIAVTPSIQVSNGLVVHQMLTTPIVERGVGQYANKVAKCLVLPAFSWQIRLVGTVVPNHE